MKNKKFLGFLSLVTLMFTLTGCPGRDYDDSPFRKQGAIHEIGLIDPNPGLMIHQAQRDINIKSSTHAYAIQGELQDVVADVKSHYVIYNNLDKTTMKLALPLTRAFNNDDEKELEKIIVTTDDNGLKASYEPQIAYGPAVQISKDYDYHYDSSIYRTSLNEIHHYIENKKEAPQTVFEYKINFASNNETLFQIGTSDSQALFYFPEAECSSTMRFMNDGMLLYYVLKPKTQTQIQFYSTIRFELPEGNDIVDCTINEVDYHDNIVAPLSSLLYLNENLVNSLIDFYLEQNGYLNFVQLAEIMKSLNDNNLWLQSYLLYYTIPIRGNNASLILDIEYPICVEKHSSKGKDYFYLKTYQDGLETFDRVDSYYMNISVLGSIYDEVKIDYRGAISFSKESKYTFSSSDLDSTSNLNISLEAYYKVNSGCQSFKTGFRVALGSFFIFIYLLIELGYRRKKNA